MPLSTGAIKICKNEDCDNKTRSRMDECGKCYYARTRERRREVARRWYADGGWRNVAVYTQSQKGKDTRVRNTRKSTLRFYGLTESDFDEMFEAQGGRCAICYEIPEKILCVDHDHETGKVRALLCDPCNKALGHVNDNMNILKNMINYLEAFKEV